jgi:hypothetical protein
MVAVAAAIGGTRPNRGDGERERRIRLNISYPWTAPSGAGGTEGLQRRAFVASAHPAAPAAAARSLGGGAPKAAAGATAAADRSDVVGADR